MTVYSAPVKDMMFLFEHLKDNKNYNEIEKYKEVTSDLVKDILEEAAKINEGMLLPLAKAGDENPCVYENGVVRTPPGYKEAYSKFIEDGWVSLTCDPKYGGQGMPKTVSAFFDEMLSSSSLSFKLYSELSIGAYNCILSHATEEIKNITYESLTEDNWKDRIVIRSSNNMYNQSLVASLIAKNGERETEAWAKALVKNLARKPQGNDRAQIMAVANGEADLAVANSYYIGIMLSGNAGVDQFNAAKRIKMIFPNQSTSGAHINISGAGILKNAPNPENANLFIGFLLSDRVQEIMVKKSYEYPIANVSVSSEMASLGEKFKEDNSSVKRFGELNPAAIKLMDRAGWK